MPEPTHQLVIQFPQSAFADFDDMVRYEDALIDALAGGSGHDVDGHDIGSGEVNFFVFTDDPTVALGAVRDAREGLLLSHPQVRAAARPVSGEQFTPLWPVGDERDFTIA
jgi:hypothetical protein